MSRKPTKPDEADLVKAVLNDISGRGHSTAGLMYEVGRRRIVRRRYPSESQEDYRARLAREDELERDRQQDPTLAGGRRRPIRYDE
jgi:hypothetical protein